MGVVIQVEHLSKLYNLGEIGTGTASRDLARWWARTRGKEDPFAKVGQVNDRTQKASKGEMIWALNDINFQIEQGEAVGLIGRNGAGKSTALKILSRITAPTSGVVRIKGRMASLLEVGTGFHPEMTGRENVYMNGTILGMSRAEVTRKLDEIVEFAGVAKYVDTPVKRYSSGMMVRLGFAVAAHLEPEILVVDEVLAVGDAEFQKKAMGKMEDVIQKDGRTILFVSHNLNAVKSLCRRALLMDRGTILKDGPSEEVVPIYTNSQVVFDEVENSKFKIDQFQIWYKEGGTLIQSSAIPFGKDFEIGFNVTIKDFEVDSKVYFSIGVRNRDGQLITSLDNLYSGNAINLEGSKHFKVICTVNSNYLIPAEYYLEIWSGTFFEIYLRKHVIGKIQIVFSDYFGNGKLHNERQHGNVLLPNTWKKVNL